MTFLQYLLPNKHKNTLTSCMLRTSALTILCKPCCYKFMSIDFLRLRFAKTDTWSDRIPNSTKLSNLCSDRRVILLSTYLLLESHLYFFVPGQQAGRLAAALLEVPAWSRGWSQSWGWFHPGWGLLSGRALVLEDLQTACPTGIWSLSAMMSCYVTHLLTFQ